MKYSVRHITEMRAAIRSILAYEIQPAVGHRHRFIWIPLRAQTESMTYNLEINIVQNSERKAEIL